MDLIPCWNGSLDRQGVCPSLSGYLGPSQLGIPDKRAARESAPLMVHSAEKAVIRRRAYDQRRGEKARAQAAQAALEAQRAGLMANRSARQAKHKARMWVANTKRKAQQLSLLEAGE